MVGVKEVPDDAPDGYAFLGGRYVLWDPGACSPLAGIAKRARREDGLSIVSVFDFDDIRIVRILAFALVLAASFLGIEHVRQTVDKSVDQDAETAWLVSEALFERR